MLNALCVFFGGGLGATFRWLITSKIPYHWGTMFVNIIGACLIGVVYGYISTSALKPEVKLIIMTGLLGGFTTFSTYLLDFAVLCQKDNFMEAMVYLVGSIIVGVSFLYLGIKASQSVWAA